MLKISVYVLKVVPSYKYFSFFQVFSFNEHKISVIMTNLLFSKKAAISCSSMWVKNIPNGKSTELKTILLSTFRWCLPSISLIFTCSAHICAHTSTHNLFLYSHCLSNFWLYLSFQLIQDHFHFLFWASCVTQPHLGFFPQAPSPLFLSSHLLGFSYDALLSSGI